MENHNFLIGKLTINGAIPNRDIYWLVVSNIWINFPCHIWDAILPIDELIFFKMVKTTNQRLY